MERAQRKKTSKTLPNASIENTAPYSNGLQPLSPNLPASEVDMTNGSTGLMPDLSQLSEEEIRQYLQITGQNQPTGISARSEGNNSNIALPAVLDEGLQKRNVKLRDNWTKLYTLLGTVIFAFNPVDGTLIIMEAHQRATELILVAQHHKKMMEWLERLAAGNDYVNMAVGHAGVALAVLVNHDRLPSSPLTKPYEQSVYNARAYVESARLTAQAQANNETAMA